MPNEITLADLLPQMEAQATRMSVKNPTRKLLWIAAQVLIQQAKEIVALRDLARQKESGIIAPFSQTEAQERRIIVP